MDEVAVTVSDCVSLAAPVPMPARLTVCAGAFSLMLTLAMLVKVGASLTAFTVTVKGWVTVLFKAWPSLTVTVIVAEPLPVAVIVALVPEPLTVATAALLVAGVHAGLWAIERGGLEDLEARHSGEVRKRSICRARSSPRAARSLSPPR